MSPTLPSDDDLTTPEAFNTALIRLLQTAAANGVDVQGGWECRTDDGTHDWEAVIVELAASQDAPDDD